MSEDVPIYAPPPIKGYRKLSNRELEEVNTMKGSEEALLAKLEKMRGEDRYDQRWLAIGRTHIEQGFMAIVRAILRPGKEP